jgi:hypothetical protein
MLSNISRSLEHDFNGLVENVPDLGDPGHDDAMRVMINEDNITSSDMLVTYLTVSNMMPESGQPKLQSNGGG